MMIQSFRHSQPMWRTDGQNCDELVDRHRKLRRITADCVHFFVMYGFKWSYYQTNKHFRIWATLCYAWIILEQNASKIVKKISQQMAKLWQKFKWFFFWDTLYSNCQAVSRSWWEVISRVIAVLHAALEGCASGLTRDAQADVLGV